VGWGRISAGAAFRKKKKKRKQQQKLNSASVCSKRNFCDCFSRVSNITDPALYLSANLYFYKKCFQDRSSLNTFGENCRKLRKLDIVKDLYKKNFKKCVIMLILFWKAKVDNLLTHPSSGVPDIL
jgi:hypothetical protein